MSCMVVSSKVKAVSATVVCVVVCGIGFLTGFYVCRTLWGRADLGVAVGHVGLGTEIEETDPIGAMCHYSIAIGAAPGLPLPYLKLGELLERQGYKEQALTVYEDVVQCGELHSYDLNLVNQKIDSLRQGLRRNTESK